MVALEEGDGNADAACNEVMLLDDGLLSSLNLSTF